MLGALLPLALCAPAMAQSVAPNSAPQAGVAEDAPSGRVFVYPNNGQTPAQQSVDRSECHNWASNQSGFDPSQPGGGVPPNQNASRRAEYQRAAIACLQARGYSVSFPPAPPPAPTHHKPQYVEHYSPPPAPELKYHPFAVQIDGGYSISTGTTDQYLDGGPSGGLGLTWFPTSALPLGLRVDGSYNRFRARNQLLNLNGAGYTSGHEDIYGGDADLQLDIAHRSSRAKMYLFGGIGRYRERIDLRRVSLVSGTICSIFWCEPGVFPAVTAEQHTTSTWHNSWNAGIGWEAAIAERGSFFVEARFVRILPNNSKTQFVPIRVGFRF